MPLKEADSAEIFIITMMMVRIGQSSVLVPIGTMPGRINTQN